MKNALRITLCLSLCIACVFTAAACQNNSVESAPVLNGFDTALPDFSGLSTDKYFFGYDESVDGDRAAVEVKLAADGITPTADGWYPTLIDNFDYNADYADNMGLDPEIWTSSVHGVRWASQDDKHPEYACYWCPDMVSVSADGHAAARTVMR